MNALTIYGKLKTFKKQLSTHFYSQKKVMVVFLTLAILWSLTPLGVVWSVREFSVIWSLLLRFGVAAIVMTIIKVLQKTPFPISKPAFASYAAGAVSVFGSMLLCYLGAQYLPSAMISIIFGLSPITTGLLLYLTGQQSLTLEQWATMLLAIGGLWIATASRLLDHSASPLPAHYLKGVGLILIAMLLNVISILLVKRQKIEIAPISQAAGSLYIALLGTSILSIFFGPPIAIEAISNKAILAVIFLALGSSVFAFILFFWLIRQASPLVVALLTVASPVLATFWGQQLNGEPVTQMMVVGLALVIIGVISYLTTEQRSLSP